MKKTLKEIIQEEIALALLEAAFDAKDQMRIKDMFTKSKGNDGKLLALAKQMAKSIKDANKAWRRGEAAKAAVNEPKFHNIFFDRAKELGYTDPNAKPIKRKQPRRAWAGKLGNVDQHLQNIYGDMSSGDQKLKDDLFWKYYRYYNDGDVLAFPSASLKKLGVSNDSLNILKTARQDVKFAQRYRSSRNKNSPIIVKYEEAMEEAIAKTMLYFIRKYKNLWNTESRQKTYDTWKKEIMKYAQSGDGLKSYWVKEFGEQFGIPALVNYAKKAKDHKITDPGKVGKITTIMLKIIQKKKVNEQLNEGKQYWLSAVGKDDDYGDKITDQIIDGKTKEGPWALMTPKSFKKHGMGKFGTGIAQRFEKQSDGKWLKVEG